MTFDWDEDKRLANARKHGIDFVDAVTIFEGDTVTIEDDRFDYGEVRWTTLGLYEGRVIVVVHTEREKGVIRIISARKATKHEAKSYFKQITE
jgi:uncharacterized DUF497 family protein